MSSVEAYFMGGPADRTYQAVQCDDPMRPPRITTFITAPDLRSSVAKYDTDQSQPPSKPVRIVHHTYRLQPSQLDDGPRWVYVHEPTAEQQAGERRG